MTADDDIRGLLARLYESFNTGDPRAWTDNLARDVVGIGTDPDEWWEGSDLVAKVVTAQLEQMTPAGIRMVSGDPVVRGEGNVFWALDRPRISTPDGTTTEARLTLIATRRGGRLQIDHFHLSTGVPNEDMLGQELPTS